VILPLVVLRFYGRLRADDDQLGLTTAPMA
jgi:hypothetical protein